MPSGDGNRAGCPPLKTRVRLFETKHSQPKLRSGGDGRLLPDEFRREFAAVEDERKTEQQLRQVFEKRIEIRLRLRRKRRVRMRVDQTVMKPCQGRPERLANEVKPDEHESERIKIYEREVRDFEERIANSRNAAREKS